MPAIVIDEQKCKGCNLCVEKCPKRILQLTEEINLQGFRYAKMVDSPRCIGCKICAIMCPDLAIEVYSQGAMYEFYSY